MGIKYIDDQIGGNVSVKHGVTTFPARDTLAIDGDNVDVTDTGSLIQVQVHPETRSAAVADLRAKAGTTGERASLAGPAGGEFERIASGTDDGGTVFVATGYGTTGAAWKRVYSGPLDVRWFGADDTGSADSFDAIQKAVTAARGLESVSNSLSSMPELLFPAGTYKLTEALDLLDFSGQIFGEGAVLYGNDHTKDLIKNVSRGITVRGLSFAGGRDAIAIATSNADTVVINLENCSFRRVGRRHISADSNSDSTILNVNGCRFISDSYSVKSATNASPIVIETYVAHEFETGDSVNVVDVEGNTAANGTWTVTKVDATHFSLNGSIGNGVAILPGAGNNGCGKAADLFVFNTLNHVNFLDCWVTSPRNVTWNAGSSRLRIRGGIFVPGSAPSSAVWIKNDNGTVWASQAMFSGERPRKILTSGAAASFGAAKSVVFRDNFCSAPTSESPFTFTAIPNEIKIRNNVGLLAITVPSGGGNKVSGYTVEGAQAVIDIDSQYMRLFSADSDNMTRDTFLARMLQPEPNSTIALASCVRSLEAFEIGEADYGPLVSGTSAINTISNDAGLNVLTAAATADGQTFVKQYTAALTGLDDGPYTVVVPVTVVGPAVEILLEFGDSIERHHLSAGFHNLALPFVWKTGTVNNTFALELRDMPNGAYVQVAPFEIIGGHVHPDARLFATAPPSGNTGHRWLKGSVIWNSNPTVGGPLAWICTASSTRVAAKTFDAGTWTPAGHAVTPGAADSIPVSDGTSYSWTTTPRLSASGYVEFGASAATTGFLRAPNNSTAVAIKGVSSGHALTLSGDNFDQAKLEGKTNAFLLAGATFQAGLGTNSALRFAAGDASLTAYVTGFAIDQAVAESTWGYLPKTSNADPVDWNLVGQSAFAGSNDTGGYINIKGGTKDGSGLEGGVRLRDGSGGNVLVIGDAQKLGFFGVAIAARTAAYTQTYATTSRTHAAYTSDPESSAYTGAADGEAKLADLNALRVAYENLRVAYESTSALLNQVIDDLQTYGLLQ